MHFGGIHKLCKHAWVGRILWNADQSKLRAMYPRPKIPKNYASQPKIPKNCASHDIQYGKSHRCGKDKEGYKKWTFPSKYPNEIKVKNHRGIPKGPKRPKNILLIVTLADNFNTSVSVYISLLFLIDFQQNLSYFYSRNK